MAETESLNAGADFLKQVRRTAPSAQKDLSTFEREVLATHKKKKNRRQKRAYTLHFTMPHREQPRSPRLFAAAQNESNSQQRERDRERDRERHTQREKDRNRKSRFGRGCESAEMRVDSLGRSERARGEGEREHIKEMRMLEPNVAVEKICGMADLESSKRQLRAAVRKFWAFLKEGKMTFREEEAPVLLVRWLQTMLRNNPKIKRISTLMQYARQIQSVLRVNVLQSATVRKYFKGLGRLNTSRKPSGR